MSISLKAKERSGKTQSDLRQLRAHGRIPAVVYGKKIDVPASISVEAKELLALLRSHPNAVVEMEVPSAGKQPVMMTEIQRDPLSRQLLHIDFRQIDMNEEVKTAIHVDITGEAAGVKAGGVLQILLHEVEIQCLPGSIPESVQVDITDLEIGDQILVSDLKLVSGVTVLSEPGAVVAAVLVPQKAEEEDAEAAGEADNAAAPDNVSADSQDEG
ncbi:50S ribosomal protein L25/general stress protein Ctc [Paenibacillaceae bacterium]|nr:50S ribosomal protein L25/general stress protein Ctc [Paenibacillaceae bacterium]